MRLGRSLVKNPHLGEGAGKVIPFFRFWEKEFRGMRAGSDKR